MFSALSYNFGDLQDKLNYFAALAPIVNLRNSPNTLMQAGASNWWGLFKTASLFGTYELNDPKTDKFMRGVCDLFGRVCTGIEQFFNIDYSPLNNVERTTVHNARPGSSASLRQVVHYA